METPEFCHRLSVSEWYSFVGLFIYRMVTCPMQQDDGSALTLTAEIFIWKSSKTAIWLKLEAVVCITTHNAKTEGNLQPFRIRIWQFFLMMLYKLNYPVSELAALPGLRAWLTLDILHTPWVFKTLVKLIKKGKCCLNGSSCVKLIAYFWKRHLLFLVSTMWCVQQVLKFFSQLRSVVALITSAVVLWSSWIHKVVKDGEKVCYLWQ